jgi:hypothetical protein
MCLSASAWASNVITGCLETGTGVLYHVDEGPTPSEPCRDDDREVQWNVVGPAGPAGQQGPAGPAGPAPKTFQFVGVTLQTLPGNVGWQALTKACHAEFPGSRMASFGEYRTTVNPPDFSANAWINGFRETCFDWQGSPTARGSILSPEGKTFSSVCGSALSVACAAPVE